MTYTETDVVIPGHEHDHGTMCMDGTCENCAFCLDCDDNVEVSDEGDSRRVCQVCGSEAVYGQGIGNEYVDW